MVKHWFGHEWAQPVVSRRWAFIATLLHAVSRLTGYRIFVAAKHNAWLKAVTLVIVLVLLASIAAGMNDGGYW